MAPSYFIKMKTRWLFVHLLLLSAVQDGVQGVHCPSCCVCEFDDILERNMAKCTFSNTTVNISWQKSYGNLWLKSYEDTKLEVNCADQAENYQYDCNDLPQFNISSNNAELVVQGCTSSIMKCVHKMFTPVSTITKFEVKVIASSFTTDDLVDFDHVIEAQINLENEGTEVQAITLNALKSIKYLIMKGGNLRLSSNALKLPKLETLDLEQNNIRDVPPNAFKNLPKLRTLNILSNNFEHLGANFVRDLDSLESLFFVNNSLISIDPAALSTTKQLFSLYIGNNRLKLVPNGLFTGLDELYQVNVIENQVELSLDTHAFANLPPSVRVVNIKKSNIKYLPEYVFNGSVHISHLFLQNNEIESLPAKIFATTASLMDVDLSWNEIQNLPDDIFSGLKQLQSIDLSHNHLSVLREDIFKHNTKLEKVNLNDNSLTYIERNTFKGMNLINLNLASNELQQIGDGPLEWHTKTLRLNNNELSVFEDRFVELVNLEQLDLSGNKIKMIKASQIHQVKGKTKIDLRNNNITEIVPDTSAPVNVTKADVTLYLSNNPLQCGGIVTALLKEWHDRGILLDYEDVACGYKL